MSDSQIIELYNTHPDLAVRETDKKYGRLIRAICGKILRNDEDREECVNDVYVRLWHRIPGTAPENFSSYIRTTARNTALDRLEKELAEKRGGGKAALVIGELEECIPSRQGFAIIAAETKEILNRFLETQDQTDRKMFVRRYWLGESVKEIADRFECGESCVKMKMSRARKKLRKMLEES